MSPLLKDKIHTIFYPGVLCSQSQITKYIGRRIIKATNGQLMKCLGFNNLDPIDVLINPFIGEEIKDVNMHVHERFFSYLNPLNVLTTSVTTLANAYQAIEVYDDDKTQKSAPNEKDHHDAPRRMRSDLKYYGINISQISLGQESDMESLHQKYLAWHKKFPADENLILWGVSRGAATTFNAMAKYKYPEVKLVVLEGCFYNVNDVVNNKFNIPLAILCRLGLSLFTHYRLDGPTPEKSVKDFPENVPVVFITSKSDELVPAASTRKLVADLVARKKNDVYLLELEHASHPNYMFDNKDDHDHYETFIHAVYRRYQLPYDTKLAAQGQKLLEQATKYLQSKADVQNHANTHWVLS